MRLLANLDGHDRPQSESGDAAMHQDGRKSVSECRDSRATASWARFCPEVYAGSLAIGFQRFYRAQKNAILRSNPGSPGECQMKRKKMHFGRLDHARYYEVESSAI
jgi:hypothetical protein